MATDIAQGYVDTATRSGVTGWAVDLQEGPVALQILDNGKLIARVLANNYRADLQAAGIGDGRHGFDVAFPGGLSLLVRHVIEVRRERDGASLTGSGMAIEPATRFDDALKQDFTRLFDALATDENHDALLDFMVTQTDRLLQRRADADGARVARIALRQFRRRWGLGAADGPADPGLRALVIDERLPVPGRDAGSQAVLSHTAALQRLGYATSLVAADGLDGRDSVLAARGITVYRAGHYTSVEDVLRRQTGCLDVIYLHRGGIAARYLALARHHAPRARLLYSVADLHHVRLERQAAIEERPELLAAARRMRLVECTAAWQADAVITHSAAEADLLRRIVPEAAVHQIGWDLPIAIPTVPMSDRAGLGFIAGFAHAPNVDAAVWLVETVMPLVWQGDPTLVCRLVGSEMPKRVRALARPGVEVVGQVDDLGAAVFDRVRLTVAPLRYGAGIKGKVLESLAAGVPCAMTPIAAEGLALPAALAGLVAPDADSLAALILALHDPADPRSEAFSQAGLGYIARGFTAAAVEAGLRAAIEGQPSIRPG